MMALHLPKCSALALLGHGKELSALFSPRFIARGAGAALWGTSSKPPMFKRVSAMPSGRAVGRRGGS